MTVSPLPERDPAIQGLHEDLQEIKDTLKGLPGELERTYVRKREHELELLAMAAEINTLRVRQDATDERLKWQGRTAITALVSPIVVAILTAMILGLLAVVK